MGTNTGSAFGMGQDPNRRHVTNFLTGLGAATTTCGGLQLNEYMKSREKKENRHAKRRETLVQTEKVKFFIINGVLDKVDKRRLLKDACFLGFGPKKPNCVSYLECSPYPNAFQSMLGKEWVPSFSYWQTITKEEVEILKNGTPLQKKTVRRPTCQYNDRYL